MHLDQVLDKPDRHNSILTPQEANELLERICTNECGKFHSNLSGCANCLVEAVRNFNMMEIQKELMAS